MVVQDCIFNIVVGEKIVPDTCLWLERIMEDELHLRVYLTNNVSDLSVESFQSRHI